MLLLLLLLLLLLHQWQTYAWIRSRRQLRLSRVSAACDGADGRPRVAGATACNVTPQQTTDDI